MDFRTLTDVPPLPPDAGEDLVRSRIAVAQLGNYTDPRYGRFAISDEDYTGWVRNLAGCFGNRTPIDFDHGPEKGGSSEAAAWITRLERATGRALKAADPERFARCDDATSYVVADVEWTPRGAAAIRAKAWLYISPTFTDHYKDEHDVDRGRALVGAALTNRPFLRSRMPVLSLSRDDFVAPAQREDAPPAPSDSRPHMTPLDNIAKALKLDADAGEDKILASIGDLRTRADKPFEVPEGKMLMDVAEVATLTANANLGAAAHKELADERFRVAWDTCVRGGCVGDAQLRTFEALHERDPKLCLETLAGLKPIVPTRPRGEGGRPLDAGDEDDPERRTLAAEAEALVKERAKDGISLSVAEAAREILETREAGA